MRRSDAAEDSGGPASSPARLRGSTAPLQIEHEAGINAAREAAGTGGDRAAQQHLGLAARRPRLFDNSTAPRVIRVAQVPQIRESGAPGLVANDDYRDPAAIAGDVVAEALQLPGALRPCCHPLAEAEISTYM